MAKTAGYLRQYRAERRANLGLPLTDPTAPHALFGPGHAKPTFRQTIRPKGRAPRGKGPEYKARRQIANRLNYVDKRIQYMQGKLMATRGQVKFRGRDSYFRARVKLLKRFKQTAIAIAKAPGNWVFKRSLINDVYLSSVQSQLSRRYG